MAVKTVEIDPKLDPMLRGLVEQAEPALERVFGGAANRVDVAWEFGGLAADGEPRARVRLTDTGVTRTEDLTAWDLADEFRLRRHLLPLWDRVLAERQRIQWRRVLESLAESGEG